MGMIERRRFPRLPVNMGVDYKALDKKESDSITMDSKNISVGGIRIILLEKTEIGSLLELKFLLPESQKLISATGRVAWVEEFIVGDAKKARAYEAGIEFINISEEDRNKIGEYVRDHLILSG